MAGPALHLQGERISGQDVRTQNVTAVATIANIVKSSLGPAGLDKMLVDDIGDVTITNDGATILKLLEVEQPAAKVRPLYRHWMKIFVIICDLLDQERYSPPKSPPSKLSPFSSASSYVRLSPHTAPLYS